MRRLSKQLTTGVVSLRNGFALLEKDPAAAEPFAVEAHKAERKMKKIYRRGMVVLLNKEKFKQHYSPDPAQPEDMAIDFAVYMMKKREIYRHLSHAADRLGRVSELLHDIIVKLI